MSFDFVNGDRYRNPGVSNGFGVPVPNRAIMDGYGIPVNSTPQQQQPIDYNFNQGNQQPSQIVNKRPYVDPRMFETPNIVTDNNSFKFAVKEDPNVKTSSDIPIDEPISETKKKGRPPKNSPVPVNNSPIVRADDGNKALNGTVENVPTAYTYMETTGMLHQTLSQIDSISCELMNEFELVRSNRALKNKYGILNGLSENIGDLIANKIAAIKEINNSISKSNDLDYKRYRDNKDALNQNDDKYISDLYEGFLKNGAGQTNMFGNIPAMNAGMYGTSGIVRADMGSSQNLGDLQYTNYIANMTPEERLMLVEGNNNIRQAMVYDPNTGNRAFQYFDFSDPSHPVPQPGLPVYSDILLDQFTIDVTNRKAKSTNLKETMDLVIANSQGQTY